MESGSVKELWRKDWTGDQMEDEAGGLFDIEISSDESVDESDKVPRDFQSEADFEKQRQEWKPKNELGEVSLI